MRPGIGLSFKLLSDPDAQVSTQYGSVMEYNGAKLSARNTFIVDPEGKIAKVFLVQAERAQRRSAQKVATPGAVS